MVPIPGCWSKDGNNILVTLLDRQVNKSTIWKISSDGKEQEQIIGHHEGVYRYLTLSPDGSLLVYSAIEGKDLGLWIMPADGGKSMQLVSEPGYNENPDWSPDGKRIVFTSTRSGNFDIWILNVNMEQIRQDFEKLNKGYEIIK